MNLCQGREVVRRRTVSTLDSSMVVIVFLHKKQTAERPMMKAQEFNSGRRLQIKGQEFKTQVVV